MYEAALFDLDGVVIDTEPTYERFWGDVGRRFYPDDADFAKKIKGQSLVHIFETYFPTPALQADIKVLLDAQEREMQYDLFPGALDMVDACRESGMKTAIVTSSNASKMECLFRQQPSLAEHFDAVFTAENVEHCKPAPDCYLQAAQDLGADISKCVVFEDSENGLRAAMSAGAHVVGLTTTTTRDVVARHSHELINNLQEWKIQN